MNPRVAITVSSLNEEYSTVILLRDSRGEHTSCRSRTHDDNVKLFFASNHVALVPDNLDEAKLRYPAY
jgi:hypothetical protein